MTANRRNPGTKLAQELKALADEIRHLIGQARDIAARPRQRRDQLVADRVCDRGEHDRNERGRLHGRDDIGGRVRDDDVDLALNQLGEERRRAIEAALCPAIFDRDIAALDPAELAQPLDEGGGPLALQGGRIGPQEADRRLPPRLLRAPPAAKQQKTPQPRRRAA
jgi:hypothetical protein